MYIIKLKEIEVIPNDDYTLGYYRKLEKFRTKSWHKSAIGNTLNEAAKTFIDEINKVMTSTLWGPNSYLK